MKENKISIEITADGWKTDVTIIFKWNEQQIPTARIIEIIGQKPLFGHTSGKGGKTIWMCFLKNEKSNETHL